MATWRSSLAPVARPRSSLDGAAVPYTTRLSRGLLSSSGGERSIQGTEERAMHTRFETVAAAAVLALAAATAASGSVELTGPGTVRIAGTQVRHIHVDVGSRGRGAGDLDIYRQLLFNRRITAKSIGHADVVCVD